MNESNKPVISQDLEAQIEAELAEALGDQSTEQLMADADQAQQPQTTPPPPAAGEPAPVQPPAEEDEPVKLDLKRGRVSRIDGDDVYIDLVGIDGKLQGVVPLTQFERSPRIGSIMDFVVDRIDEAEGLMHLSREGAVGRTTWDHLHTGSVVEARVTGTNKGGLELELVGRIRAFMPASQVDIHHVEDLEPLVGEKMVAIVQEVNRRARKVLLSRRKHIEHERERKQRKIWKEIEIDQVREGTVSSLAPYGAFVDIGGVDGLVHISDMSYAHIKKPEDVLAVGDKVQVKVLKLDPEKKRISLGLKQVQPDPWEGVGDDIKPGDKISGRVLRVADFGAFIEVKPGLEGLLPVSEISWKRIHNPAEVLSVGDVLHLVVLQVDSERQRISLSLKQSTGDPWVGAEAKYAPDTMVQGSVRSTTDFGAFIELESGVEGMVHISELSDKHIDRVEDVLKPGESHEFRVIEVDEDNKRMRLSLKPAGSGSSGGERGGGDRPRGRGRRDRGESYPSEMTFSLPKSKQPKRQLKGGIE
jgi:small subunit ribosomal protein S1